MINSTNGVPIYLPDRTLAGRAEISSDRKSITMSFKGNLIAELVIENLIGFSVIYMTNEARDQIAEEIEAISKGEIKDD